MVRVSALLNVMISAARKAARGLVRDFGEVEKLQVSRKGAADFVSAADIRAEDVIYEELSRARPKFSFVMEERGVIEGADNSNRFIIDPLDGTTNFLHGLPHFSISIALERDRQPYAGVVYNPVTDDLFHAEKGEGAYLNNKRLRVTSRTDLSSSLFATGVPFLGKDGHDVFLRELVQVMGATSGIRRFGSAALDLAYVAAGRYDGYWERNLLPWDVMAGIVLVREAGGIVTEIEGAGKPGQGASILASNGVIHDAFSELLRSK